MAGYFPFLGHFSIGGAGYLSKFHSRSVFHSQSWDRVEMKKEICGRIRERWTGRKRPFEKASLMKKRSSFIFWTNFRDARNVSKIANVKLSDSGRNTLICFMFACVHQELFKKNPRKSDFCWTSGDRDSFSQIIFAFGENWQKLVALLFCAGSRNVSLLTFGLCTCTRRFSTTVKLT